VFMTANIHIALLAREGSGLISSRRSIADKPRGVAALPMPSMFAEMFIHILCMADLSSLISGKRKRVTGDKIRAIRPVMPDCSVISIMPDQKHISGASVRKRFAASDIAELSSDTRFSVCPTENE